MIKNLLSKRIIKSSLLGIIMAIVFAVSFALASIPLGSNFQLNSQLPLDARTVVVDIAARDAIPSGQRYRGLTVYVLSDATNYQLQAGITNGDWIALADAGGSMIYPGAGIAVSNGASWGPSIVNNSANWNTAFGWGNHASVGYVTGTPWTGMGYITDGNTGWDNSYGFITSLNGAVLTDQTSPQTVGNTTDRLSKLWVTDIDVEGSVVLATTVDATSGVIYKGADRFIHNFALPGTAGNNTFVGINSGNFTMTGSAGEQGSYNTGIGSFSLISNTTGESNTAVGYGVLRYNTTGESNVGYGGAALRFNTTGNDNTAIGRGSLLLNITGSGNVANGYAALAENISGNNNVATGKYALSYNTIGNNNTVAGMDSLPNLGTPQLATTLVNGTSYIITSVGTTDFTAIGAGSNTVGEVFTATGPGTGDGKASFNVSTDNNTAIGYGTGRGIITGINNTILGANVIGLPSDLSNTVILANGNGEIFAHNFALPGTDGFNTFLGVGSGNFTMTGSTGAQGSANTAVGYAALESNTTGGHNNALGRSALRFNTTGELNNAFGFAALRNNTTGNYNSAVGDSSLYENTTGDYNVALGSLSLFSNVDGFSNVAIGSRSMEVNVSGSNNVANGMYALFTNVTGSNNTALGAGALSNLGNAQTAGDFNVGTSYTILTVGDTDFTAIGAGSNIVGEVFTATGVGVGTGTATANNTDNNIAIGFNAGGGIVTGVNNTIIGPALGLSPNLSNNIILADGEGNRRINVDNVGNVGIGTTAPGELLSLGLAGTTKGVLSLSGNTSGKIIIQPADVAGTYTLTLPTTVGGAGQVLTDIAGDGVLGWTSGGGGGFTDPTTTAGDIIIRNALNVTTRLGAGNAGQVLTSDGTNISWEDPAGVSGAQTPWLSDINAAGYTLFGNDTISGNLTLDSTSTSTKGNVLINPSGGNVGIGTTAPSSRMQVGLKVDDDNGFAYDADSLMVIHQTPTGTATLNDPKNVLLLARQGTAGEAYGAAAAFNISRFEDSGTDSRTRLDISLANTDFNVMDNNIMTLLSNGKVGIGTTTPRGKLDILTSGTDNTSGDTINGMVITGPTVGTGSYSGMLFIQSNDDQAADMGGSIAFGARRADANTEGSYFASIMGAKENSTSEDYSGYLRFNTRTAGNNDSEVMRLTSAGMVGIGTTTPTQILDVVGSIALPTTVDATSGVIYKGADRFIHNFALPGTDGGNTFAGLNAGNFTMTGSTGSQGSYNTGLGQNSLQSNTTGGTNSAIGFESLRDNSTGNNNTANGMQALSLNTTGSNNTAIGAQALYDLNGSGNNNTAIGFDTGRGIETGINNTIIGANVTGLDANLSDNIIIADGAGNRRINVNSSGNVGIGTTEPGVPFHVVSDLGLGAGVHPIATIKKSNGAANEIGGLDFGYYANGTDVIAGMVRSNAVGIGLALGTIGNPLAQFIAYNGNVGIGTIDPQKKLEINDDDANTTTSGLRFTDFACTGDDKLTVGAGGDVICATDQTGGGAGNVEDTLTATLGAGNDANALDITNIGRLYTALGTEGSPAFSFQADTDTGMWSSATNILNFSTDATERMRIDNLGNVGIGTNAPSSLLSVHYGVDTGDTTLPSGTWASQILNINDATGEGALVVANRWANVDTQIFSVGNMCDGCGNAGFDTFFSVFGDGKVGIGTTTPGAELDVNGTIESNGLSISYAGTSANIYSYNNSAYPGIYAESQGGAGVEGYSSGANGFGVYGNAGNSTGTGVYGQSKNGHGVHGFINGSLGGATNSAGYFEATGTGYGLIVASGNVGIGNTAPATALDVTGTIRQSNCTTAGTLSANTSGDIICTPSSQEFKDNISDLTTGLSDILALRPVSYTFKPEMDMGSATRFGFISEEVSALVPEFATHDADGDPYGLDNGAILAASINAIKELNLNLEGIAGTITPLEDSDNETFVTAFFDNIKTTIGAWLADATNGIGNLFADVFNAKEKICIDGECLTKDDVRALLLLVHPDGSPISDPDPEPAPDPDPIPVPDPTSTPESTPEPEVTPEEIPTPEPEPVQDETPALEIVPISEPEPASEETPTL